MARIGSRAAAGCALFLLAASAWGADKLEFRQEADQTQVGVGEVFQLTVEVVNAPGSAELQLPDAEAFEVLSKSQSTQMTYEASTRGFGSLKRIQRFVLSLRANRAGTFTIPPARLEADGKAYKTEPVQIEVKSGQAGGSRAQRPSQTQPFPGMPWPGLDDDDPRADLSSQSSPADLFLKSSVDKSEVYVGQQTTLSIYLYSRMDLTEVSALNLPKLDGFWSEDLDSPTQLSAERRTVNGLPYRVYLLKRRALFPTHEGKLEISPAEVDVVTGFLFAGRRLHRVGNSLSVLAKALPNLSHADATSANVGEWKLSVEAASSRVELGQPVNVRVTVEGRGNVRNVVLPKLTGPASLHIYDPTTSEKLSLSQGVVGGRKTQEYVVVPQQTGTWTLSALSLPYFDPEAERYQTAQAGPLVLTVVPGASASAQAGVSISNGAGKNVLAANQALRPLRPRATFVASGTPFWATPVFRWALAVPPGLWIAALVGSMLLRRPTRETAEGRKKKSRRVVHKRLATAKSFLSQGSADEFYGEIEKALTLFLETQLNQPVVGLTRDALEQKLTDAGVSTLRRAEVLKLLQGCDLGRFAKGVEELPRARVLEQTAQVMEGWELT